MEGVSLKSKNFHGAKTLSYNNSDACFTLHVHGLLIELQTVFSGPDSVLLSQNKNVMTTTWWFAVGEQI